MSRKNRRKVWKKLKKWRKKFFSVVIPYSTTHFSTLHYPSLILSLCYPYILSLYCLYIWGSFREGSGELCLLRKPLIIKELWRLFDQFFVIKNTLFLSRKTSVFSVSFPLYFTPIGSVFYPLKKPTVTECRTCANYCVILSQNACIIWGKYF